jgi:hypothetical protein
VLDPVVAVCVFVVAPVLDVSAKTDVDNIATIQVAKISFKKSM